MDYAPIQAFLVGRCGRTIRDAARTSYEEFTLLAEGKSREEHAEWERARWMIYMDWAISPNLKRRPHTPQESSAFRGRRTGTRMRQGIWSRSPRRRFRR